MCHHHKCYLKNDDNYLLILPEAQVYKKQLAYNKLNLVYSACNYYIYKNSSNYKSLVMKLCFYDRQHHLPITSIDVFSIINPLNIALIDKLVNKCLFHLCSEVLGEKIENLKQGITSLNKRMLGLQQNLNHLRLNVNENEYLNWHLSQKNECYCYLTLDECSYNEQFNWYGPIKKIANFDEALFYISI